MSLAHSVQFRGDRGLSLSGIYTPSSSRSVCVLLCYPFAEERKFAHRAYRELTDRLAANDLACLRFDYSGCGNSDGDLCDATLDGWMNDIACTVHFIRELAYRRILCIGLRMGATLLWQSLDRGLQVDRLLLWEPLTDLQKYLGIMTRRAKLHRVFAMRHIANMVDVSTSTHCIDLNGNLCGTRLISDFNRDGVRSLLSLQQYQHVTRGNILLPGDSIALAGKTDVPRVITIRAEAFWSMGSAKDFDAFIDQSCFWCRAN